MPTAPRAPLGANSSSTRACRSVLLRGPPPVSRLTPGFHIPLVPRRPGYVLSRLARRILVPCACALVLSVSANVALAAPDAAPAPIVTPGAALADFAESYVGSPYR